MTDINDQIKAIGDVISHGEGNYESYNTGTKGVLGGKVGHSFVNRPVGTVTGKTIDYIIGTDSVVGGGKNPARMFATGKYQTTIPTLKSAKEKLLLPGNAAYDAPMQERVFREFLLQKAGGGTLGRFVFQDKGSVDDAQYAAAKEWASIGVPSGKTDLNGVVSDGYRSYYHQPGQNTANQESTRAIRALLQAIFDSRQP